VEVMAISSLFDNGSSLSGSIKTPAVSFSQIIAASDGTKARKAPSKSELEKSA
jgi:hypothetical protein